MANPVVTYVLALKDNASKVIKETGEEADKTGGKMKGLGKAAKVGAQLFLGLATATLAAAMAFVKLASGVADTRNQLTDLSTRTGVATSTLKAVGHAAEGAGLSLQEMEGVFKKLPRVLADAQKGSTRTAKSMALIGLSLEDVSEMNPDTLFQAIATGLSAIEDPGQRATAATAALGEEGTKLLQVLGDPSSLDAFIESTERWGTDVGPAATREAANYQRALATLSLSFDTLKEALVSSGGGMETMNTGIMVASQSVVFMAELMKGLGGIMTRFFETMLTYPRFFIALMRGDFQGAMDVMSGALSFWTDELPGVWDEAAQSTQDFTNDMQSLADALDSPGLDTVTAGAIGLKEALEGAGEAAKGLSDAEVLKAVLGGGGLGLPGAGASDTTNVGIGINLDAVQADIDGSKSEMADLKKRFSSWVDTSQADREAIAAQVKSIRQGNVQAGVGAASSILTGDVLGAASSLGGPQVQAVVMALQGLQAMGEMGVDQIRDELNALLDGILAGLKMLPDILGEVLPDFFDSIISDFIPAFIKNMPAIIEPIMSAIISLPFVLVKNIGPIFKEILKAVFIQLPGAIWEGVSDIWSMAGTVIKDAAVVLGKVFKEIIPDFIKGIGETIKTWWAGVWDRLKGLFDFDLFNREDKDRKGLRDLIPSFDRGGYVPQTGLALVHQGERIRQPGGTFSQSGRDRGGMGGSGQGGVTINTVTLDSNVIPALVARMEEVYGSFGTSTSTLFQGS